MNIRTVTFQDDPDPNTFNFKDFNLNLNPFQRHGILGNFFQWNNMKKCSEIKANLECKEGEYDLVIWSRPDLFFYNDLEDVNSLEDRLWLIGHDNHLCGLNDRFCLGNSSQIHDRMNILDYFTNEWYSNYSDDKTILFESKASNQKHRNPQWNPEIVFKTFVRNKKKFHTGKLSLCFGKLRSPNLATIPYWFEKHGTDYTGNNCVEDKYNNYIYEKTTKYSVNSSDISSSWGLVNLDKYQSEK